MIQNVRLWLDRAINGLVAALLAAIFIVFLIQIFARYAPNLAYLIPVSSVADWLKSVEPIGWTVNLISFLWVWLIFFGCSFVVGDKDHVVFDVFLHAVNPGVARFMRYVVATLLISAMLYALIPMWDAVFGSRLMELKKIQTLRIPFSGEKIAIKWLFAPFIMLMIALIVRYSLSMITLVRSQNLEEAIKEASE